MNEDEIKRHIEAAVIDCIAQNDVAMPMIIISEALLQIRKKVVNGDYDQHERL